jgi:hypothetical protein
VEKGGGVNTGLHKGVVFGSGGNAINQDIVPIKGAIAQNHLKMLVKRPQQQYKEPMHCHN